MMKHTLFSGKNRYQMVCIAKYVCYIPVGFEVKCNLPNSWHITSGHLKVLIWTDIIRLQKTMLSTFYLNFV